MFANEILFTENKLTKNETLNYNSDSNNTHIEQTDLPFVDLPIFFGNGDYNNPERRANQIILVIQSNLSPEEQKSSQLIQNLLPKIESILPGTKIYIVNNNLNRSDFAGFSDNAFNSIQSRIGITNAINTLIETTGEKIIIFNTSNIDNNPTQVILSSINESLDLKLSIMVRNR